MISPRVRSGAGARARGGAATFDVAEVGAALAICAANGRLVAYSPTAATLLSRLGADLDATPAALPEGLWPVIDARPIGEAVQWRSASEDDLVLGCTRHRLGADRWMLMMCEISRKQRWMAQQLHQQRLEALGRLVATTVHDLRTPLSSIVFNSDVIATRFDELGTVRVQEAVADIQLAARRLRAAIDCLLDYVRIGPPLPSEVSLSEIVTRIQGLLRPVLRQGAHRVIAELVGCDAVLINPLALEQIFVNLVLNAIEAGAHGVTVRFTSTTTGKRTRILVEDDGPGISEQHRLHVFDPFFTTKATGTGIGLSAAREAARDANGDLELVRWVGGAAFALTLPNGAA